MKNIKEAVVDILKDLKGSGRFVSQGNQPFKHPGLEIKGIGELAFPFNDLQAMALLKIARKAPFGKGLATVYDDQVRSAWEIDATELRFIGDGWEKQLSNVLLTVKKDLGLEGYTITSTLYKLLIYETGDFFLPHRDTEKEKGMFGTLILGLPSRHTGGELVVSFGGEQQEISFGDKDNIDILQYAAFYADCEHEIKPLTGGYRICLVYNLLQKSGAIQTPDRIVQSAVQLAEIFKQAPWTNSTHPQVILLGHQYTPENFSVDHLKLNDRARAAALLQAAEKAGYYARLCLVTSYQSGMPDGNGYYEYGDDVDEYATMDEVYDSSLSVDHWAEAEIPALYPMELEEEELITSFAINDGDPLVKESTGYMGNYGPDLMHWYHYGAVIIWSHETNAHLLPSLDPLAVIQWVDYFNNHPEAAIEGERNAIRSSLRASMTETRSRKATNFNAVASWIILQEDSGFFKGMALEVLENFVLRIETNSWVRLIEFLGEKDSAPVFELIGSSARQPVLEQFTNILRAMQEENLLADLVRNCIVQLPRYLSNTADKSGKKNKPATEKILSNILYFANHLELPDDWHTEILSQVADLALPQYRNGVVVPFLMGTVIQGTFLKALFNKTVGFFQELKEPNPPGDWIRDLPENALPKKIFGLLIDFFCSPVDACFDYRAVQSERKDMEYALGRADLEVRTETIKKGSPHTLRIIKTAKNYENAHRQWELDMQQLEQLKER